MPNIDQFIQIVESQTGDRYVFGAEAHYWDPNPVSWDCSELTSWGAARAGGSLPDGAAAQLAWCQKHRTILPSVNVGIHTYGALLFRVQRVGVNHVAVSLGNGSTFEAKGRAYGVNYFHAAGRRWTHAALIPGFTYSKPVPIPTPVPHPTPSPKDEEDMTPDLQKYLDTMRADIIRKVDETHADVEEIQAKVRKHGIDLGTLKQKAEATEYLSGVINERTDRIEKALDVKP